MLRWLLWLIGLNTDGLVFCAAVHRLNPTALDFYSCSPVSTLSVGNGCYREQNTEFMRVCIEWLLLQPRARLCSCFKQPFGTGADADRSGWCSARARWCFFDYLFSTGTTNHLVYCLPRFVFFSTYLEESVSTSGPLYLSKLNVLPLFSTTCCFCCYSSSVLRMLHISAFASVTALFRQLFFEEDCWERTKYSQDIERIQVNEERSLSFVYWIEEGFRRLGLLTSLPPLFLAFTFSSIIFVWTCKRREATWRRCQMVGPVFPIRNLHTLSSGLECWSF